MIEILIHLILWFFELTFGGVWHFYFKKTPPNFSAFALPFDFSSQRITQEVVTLYQLDVPEAINPEAIKIFNVKSLENAIKVAHYMGHLQLQKKKTWAWRLFNDRKRMIDAWMKTLFFITIVAYGILFTHNLKHLPLLEDLIISLFLSFLVVKLFEICFSKLIKKLLLYWVEQKASNEGVKLLLSVSRSEQQAHNTPAPSKKDIQILKQLMVHYAQWSSNYEKCQKV